MTLYYKNGLSPRDLPSGDFGSDGWFYQPLNTPEVIDLCGWVEAPDKPEVDENLQSVRWSVDQWVIEDLGDDIVQHYVDVAKQNKNELITSTRYDKQQVFTYGSRQALSDDVTIGRITAKVLLLQYSNTANTSTLWKFGPGDYASLSVQDLIDYGNAINSHVQNCFINEAMLQAQVQACTTVAEVDSVDISVGW